MFNEVDTPWSKARLPTKASLNSELRKFHYPPKVYQSYEAA
jgi:hypothetical protein